MWLSDPKFNFRILYSSFATWNEEKTASNAPAHLTTSCQPRGRPNTLRVGTTIQVLFSHTQTSIWYVNPCHVTYEVVCLVKYPNSKFKSYICPDFDLNAEPDFDLAILIIFKCLCTHKHSCIDTVLSGICLARVLFWVFYYVVHSSSRVS